MWAWTEGVKFIYHAMFKAIQCPQFHGIACQIQAHITPFQRCNASCHRSHCYIFGVLMKGMRADGWVSELKLCTFFAGLQISITIEQSSAAFSQKFEFSNYLSPFILLVSCMCEDLQSLESVWWTEAGDCLDSPFVSDGSHDAATSNCQLSCLWNIQLLGVINIRCSHRMVPQWKIHNQQWYSRKQQVSRSFNFSLHWILRYVYIYKPHLC